MCRFSKMKALIGSVVIEILISRQENLITLNRTILLGRDSVMSSANLFLNLCFFSQRKFGNMEFYFQYGFQTDEYLLD